jgi:N-acetylneuraminate lyase
VSFAGILPAAVTPLDGDERFAARSFERLLERLYEAGAAGVYVSGHTGEGLLQPVADREKVIDAAVRNSPNDRTVIAHVGALRTADAVRLARSAARAGVHAVSSLPPIGQYSFEEVKAYYARLAAAAEVPVLIYYFPEYSAAISTLAAQRELLAIPGVAGIKFTSFDLYSLSLLKRSGAVVFNGHDEVLAAGLLMGADGGIGSFYNLVPELFVEIYERARDGDWAGARAGQDAVNELIEITLRFPMLPAIKTMLGWSGIPCGPCFAPRRRLAPDEQASLAAMLAASSFAGRRFARP